MLVALVMGITACSQRAPCVPCNYPKFQKIDKIPSSKVEVKKGIILPQYTKQVFNTIKALRISEHYYWTLITNYEKEF